MYRLSEQARTIQVVVVNTVSDESFPVEAVANGAIEAEQDVVGLLIHVRKKLTVFLFA
jgi:hypothetical protein